ASDLTAFYLWMAAGGMLGGLSVGLIAPNVFNWVAEYPILIVLAVLCRPGLAWPSRHSPHKAPGEGASDGEAQIPRPFRPNFWGRKWWGPGFAVLKASYTTRLKQAIVLGAVALAAVSFVAIRFRFLPFPETMHVWAVAAALTAAMLFWRNPLPFAAMVAF